MRALNARLARLEVSMTHDLGERVKAWLGLRGPLTAEEEAAESVVAEVDLSGCSPELRAWLTR